MYWDGDRVVPEGQNIDYEYFSEFECEEYHKKDAYHHLIRATGDTKLENEKEFSNMRGYYSYYYDWVTEMDEERF